MRSAYRAVAVSAILAAASLVIRADVTPPSQAAEVQLQLGDILFSEGRFLDSLDAYRNALKAAPADNTTRNYITDLQVQSATLGGATELAIRDGAGGAVLWRTQLQTTALPLVAFNFQSPLQGSSGNLLEVVTLSAVTGGVWVNAQGYTAP